MPDRCVVTDRGKQRSRNILQAADNIYSVTHVSLTARTLTDRRAVVAPSVTEGTYTSLKVSRPLPAP